MTPVGYTIDFGAMRPYAGLFLSGLVVTLEFSVFVLVSTFVLSIGLVAMRVSHRRLFRAIARTYVEIVRNVPALLWLYVVYFGLPSFGLTFSGETSAFIAFTLYGVAYVSEIYRGGILAINKGQWEAAAAIGLHGKDLWRFVVLPQALRTSFYPLGNIVVATVLASSLVEVVAVPDLTAAANTVGDETYRFFESFVVAAVIYFVASHAIQALWRGIGRYAFPRYAR